MARLKPGQKPKIFIASPLFNSAQHAVLDHIESCLTGLGYEFYSARHHSGSDKLSPDQKKVLANWNPVFDSNVQGLDDCHVCIANIGYQYPAGTELVLKRKADAAVLAALVPGKGETVTITHEPDDAGSVNEEWSEVAHLMPLSLPDSGTVWEMGYMRAQGKLIIGYHPEEQPGLLNLMLSHGCDGIVTGERNLQKLLLPHPEAVIALPDELQKRVNKLAMYDMRDSDSLEYSAKFFDWQWVQGYKADKGEVE